MKRYVRTNKRLNWRYLDCYQRYGWGKDELLKLEKFAESIGADIEHTGNGYITISLNGKSLCKFAIYNNHKYILYNACGVGGVLETYCKNVNEAIQKAIDTISKDSQYSHLVKDLIRPKNNPNITIVSNLKDGDIIELYAPLEYGEDWIPYKVKGGMIWALDDDAGWRALDTESLANDYYIGKIRLPKN